MQFLGTLLLFGGYTLIYAATAKGGVFATEPWNGLFTDAYSIDLVASGAQAAANVPIPGGNTTASGQPNSQAPSGGSPSAPPRFSFALPQGYQNPYTRPRGFTG